MEIFNAPARVLFDLVQRPLSGVSPFAAMVLWSLPVGVFALLVFKRFSNQTSIAAVKRRIHASLFEIRLFNDDLRSIARAQAEILRHVLVYQWLGLKPMLWILPPVVIIMVQLHTFYGFQALQPGDRALLKVMLKDEWSQTHGVTPRPAVDLTTTEGLAIETPAVWIPALNEIDWRIAATGTGHQEAVIAIGDDRQTKGIEVGLRRVRISYERPQAGVFDQLEWPAEPPLPASSPIESIIVTYPDAEISVLWWSWKWRYAWMVVFFVLTMIIALALKKPLGVEM
jgi:uncharacterized membrane protein (DUF106 family)